MSKRAARVVAIALAGWCGQLHATPYETFVDVQDQADLDDLLAAGDITTDTYAELLELLGSGVDLNTADRAALYGLPNLTYDDVDAIISYRDTNRGVISDPSVLVTAGVLSQEKLLAISAFLVVSQNRDRYNLRGWLRAMTRYSGGIGTSGFTHDKILPPFALRGRFTILRHIQAGFAGVFTRLEVGAPSYDPARGVLVADRRSYRGELPKIFLKYEDDEAALIGGSFRIGFGQRLVFDNSNRYTPNGLYIDDDLFFSGDLVRLCRESTGELAGSPCADDNQYVTPDWSWRDGLFGVAAGFKKLGIAGAGWLQGYVWASAVKRRVYQYELVNRGKCADPSNDQDTDCAAPDVLVTPEGDPLAPLAGHSFATLPDIFVERLAGANAAYFADRRSSVGLTVYGASLANLVGGIDLDTQEWSRIPTGRRYGAAGANFSLGRGWLDLFGEAAFSFDKLPDGAGPQSGGGGPAFIVRATATRKKEELEASLRYLGTDFVNPYARPIAQPDTLDGQRARDEAGVRLRYYRTSKLFTVRALLDVWEQPSQRDPSQLGRTLPKLDSYLRGDVKTTDQLWLGLWLRYQDKDLQANGDGQCFEVSTAEDTNGEPIPCGGRQITTIGRARVIPNKQVSATAMLQFQLVDDPVAEPTGFRKDWAAWLIGVYSPDPNLRLRLRARLFDEAVGSKNREGRDIGETSISVSTEAAVKLRKKDTLRVRGDIKKLLDDRASTQVRVPDPEFQLWLSYEAKL